MKLKKLYPLLIVVAFAAIVIDSCSPTLTPEPPVTLIHTKTGGVLNAADTNLYAYSLSCGCDFPLAVDTADTSSIRYDITHLKDTIAAHRIKVSARSGLASGKYTGFLAITTIPPITRELLKDTLRD